MRFKKRTRLCMNFNAFYCCTKLFTLNSVVISIKTTFFFFCKSDSGISILKSPFISCYFRVEILFAVSVPHVNINLKLCGHILSSHEYLVKLSMSVVSLCACALNKCIMMSLRCDLKTTQRGRCVSFIVSSQLNGAKHSCSNRKIVIKVCDI